MSRRRAKKKSAKKKSAKKKSAKKKSAKKKSAVLNKPITSIYLDNFKVFSSPTEIPIKPITLIFGPNSVGKSSITQSLRLLQQSLGAAPDIALIPRIEDQLDMGSYEQIVNCNDASKSFSIGLGCDDEIYNEDERHEFGYKLKFEFTQGDSHDSDPRADAALSETSLNEVIKISSIISEYYFDKGLLQCARFEFKDFSSQLLGDTENYGTFLSGLADYYDKTPEELLDAIKKNNIAELKDKTHRQIGVCTDFYISPDCQEGIYKTIHNKRKEIFTLIKEYTRTILIELFLEQKRDTEGENLETVLDSYIDRIMHGDTKGFNKQMLNIRNLFNFYSNDFSSKDFHKRMTSIFKNYRVWADNFLPNKNLSNYADAECVFEITAIRDAFEKIFTPIEVKNLLDLYSPDFIFKECVTRMKNMLYDITTLEGNIVRPKRDYIKSDIFRQKDATGAFFPKVGLHAENLADYIVEMPDVLDHINSFFENEEISHHRFSLSVVPGHSKRFELIATDTRNNTTCSLLDIGSGIYRALATLIHVSARGRVCIVEEPEAHTHPKLAAAIAEFIAETSRIHSELNSSSNFLIETHSEHFILRIKKLVREGKIEKENVSIICVESGSDGSSATAIELDDKGEFTEDWPGGFFPERLSEI